MIEQDTIKLLRECDAGVKMGIGSIEDVLEHSQSDAMRTTLQSCKTIFDHVEDKSKFNKNY